MLKIGITGGIGSGKTTACQKFAILGIPTYYADAEAKRLMVEDKKLIKQIKKLFGKQAYLDTGALNRRHIASIAFANKSKLALLNAIVHPAVGRDSLRWFKAQKNCPFALQESALLFESGSYKRMDYVITVAVKRSTRIERVMKRDGLTEQEVIARINNQMEEKEMVKRADFILYNNENSNLMQQVNHIFHKLTVK